MKRCPRCRTSYPDHAVFCATDGMKLEFETAPVDALVGTTLDGKYRIEKLIGEGGMGRVYAARHLLLDRAIAVKVLNSSMHRDSRTGERFRREAQAAGRIQHPNAVIIHDFGITQDGNAYLVMELLQGASLRSLIQRHRRLSPELASEILSQVSAAIDQAHALGIVHRDLKPDNIMVDERSDGRLSVKVLDFGIAKLKDLTEQNIQLTGTGMVIGTVHYMSPEQCRATELDGRSDIYSLGVVVFEMLTGRVPFDATTPTAVIVSHVNDEPPAPRGFNPDIPEAAQRVVLSALAKRPEDRPQTAGDLAARFAEAVAASWGGTSSPTTDAHATTPNAAYTLPINSARTRPDAGAVAQPETILVPPPSASKTPATERVASPEPRQPSRERVADRRQSLPAAVWVVLGMLVTVVAVAAIVIVVLLMRDRPGATPSGPEDPRQAQSPSPPEVRDPANGARNAPSSPRNAPSLPAATNAPSSANTPTVDAGVVEREVQGFLTSWTQSSQAKNLPAHMRHYADVVDYYLAGPVPKARVAADRTRAYAKFDSIDVRVTKIHSITPAPGGARVDVVLDKSWRFEGPSGTSTGAVKQQLVLERIGGEYKIVKERDIARY
jgi:serine/threonine protein kinase